jgi:hypothetical protein
MTGAGRTRTSRESTSTVDPEQMLNGRIHPRFQHPDSLVPLAVVPGGLRSFITTFANGREGAADAGA